MAGERPHGTFAWNELATSDPQRAMDFFRKTLGWEFEEFALEEGSYWVASADGTLVGGIGNMATGAVAAAEPYWFAFIEVDDIDRRIDMARAEGAVILRPPHDVPGVGRVAVLRDPTGAAIGWMAGAKPD
jgi:predicted enzyme related to lactoylglutathione lyase